MNNIEEIRKQQPRVAKWIDKLDEDMPVEDNNIRIRVESESNSTSYPIFDNELKSGKSVISKDSFIKEIKPMINEADFKYDIFSGELTAEITKDGCSYQYTFVRNSLARRNEIWEDLAAKGGLPIKEVEYANVFSEAQIEDEIQKQRKTNPNPSYADELEELKNQMHKHDFNKINGCIAGGVYDGQVWAMVNHAD